MDKLKPNLLIHDDNLKALKRIVANNIDQVKLVYLDPPYCSNTKNEYYCDCFDKKAHELLIKRILRLVAPLMGKNSYWFFQTDSLHSFDIIIWLDNILGRNIVRGQIVVGKNDAKKI